MTKSIAQKKIAQDENYTAKVLSMNELTRMSTQDIINGAAMTIKKGQPGVEVVSVGSKTILEQALCPLPAIDVKQIESVVRYINVLPDGQALISYFGKAPSETTLAALFTLARTAKTINGGIFSGYSAVLDSLGEEKHILSGGTVIQKGMANIRIASKDEVVFSYGSAIKKMTLKDFIGANWSAATTVDIFAKKILFMDRLQNGVTNIVTDTQVIQGYSTLTKRAVTTQDQDTKHKVLSFVQWFKTAAIIATPFGLTKEPAHALAV